MNLKFQFNVCLIHFQFDLLEGQDKEIISLEEPSPMDSYFNDGFHSEIIVSVIKN